MVIRDSEPPAATFPNGQMFVSSSALLYFVSKRVLVVAIFSS